LEKKEKELAEKKRQAMMDLTIPSLDTEEDIMKELNRLNTIKTSWKDYTLMMLNSTADPLRTIWREKITTSLKHWSFDKGSISDGNIAGIEILSVLPSEFTEMVADDHFEVGEWKKLDRLAGSKRMNVFVGHYGQESFSNEANTCIKYLVSHFDTPILECGNKTGKEVISQTLLLCSIWDFAQKSGGKCISDDELLTYLLEKTINDDQYGAWIDVADDVFMNGIPSDKYAKYWKSDKIEGYPLAISDIDHAMEYYTRDGIEISLEDQKKNFLSVCDIFLKENVAWAACWKKVAICILKNDVTMKYAGFGATLRERQAREEAIAAFSAKEEEKKKAKEEAKALALKIEKENQENK